MTKAEIVKEVSKSTGIEANTVMAVVEGFMTTVKGSMAKGENVYLRGFGTFEVKSVAAREGHNPKTGETIQIPESKKVSFSASKVLKDSLN